MLLIASPRFVLHTTPHGHPESPERAEVFDAVAAAFREAGGDVREPPLGSREEIERVHDRAYVDAIEATSGRAVLLDPDTCTSPETPEIARLAAGAAVAAARLAVERGEPTLALVRPPGHHAERDRAMGFCLYNNVAIAAAALRAQGVARVAVVDFDVHHGNGTQHAFYRDPTVLYVSSHQYPYYPGTGAAEEIGEGAGRGATLNIPLAAGATDDVYLAAYESVVVPAVEAFAPDAVLVSAGYDAHERDPLAGMRVTTAGFARIVGLLDQAALRVCGRRIAFVSEGGYDLRALRGCLEATIDVLR
jgi:acetoin utilization deacetylase AcuC-like enzyme